MWGSLEWLDEDDPVALAMFASASGSGAVAGSQSMAPDIATVTVSALAATATVPAAPDLVAGIATVTASASAATLTTGGGAIPTFQAAGATATGTGDITVAWPAHAVDDIAILILETAAQPPTLGTPSGFVAITGGEFTQGSAAGAGATTISPFWCRATSTSMASVVVTDPGNHVSGQILTFRGCIASGAPYQAVTGDTVSGGTPSATVTIPGGTTTVANCLVVAACVSSTDVDSTTEFSGWANANLSSVTERADYMASTGGGGGFGVATGGLATAGAVGNTTATLVTSAGQSRLSFALKPT